MISLANYYAQKKKAFNLLHEQIVDLMNGGRKELKVPVLILSITLKYEVSEKAIENRIKTYINIHENLFLEEDTLKVAE